MSIGTNDHFARITPVGSQQSGRVLNTLNLVFHTAGIFVFSSGWCALFMFGLVVALQDSLLATIGQGIIIVSLVWLCTVCVLVFVYPEWPHNLRLCRQLLSSVELRSDPLVSPYDPQTRVVELVPRERWKKLCLDTATDLMIMRVDPSGVWMKGDRFCYELPCDSILGAEYHAITPSGWFCQSHMVIVYVRTPEGTIDLPISYRDFSFGSLRSSRRRAQTIALAEEITGIATGHLYQPLGAPVSESRATSSWSDNPYAAPAIVNE